MKTFRRVLAIALAMVMLISCAIAGLVLPVAADTGDTFMFAQDEYYMAPTDTSGYIMYGHVPVLNMDGTPYTETLTWASSNTGLLNVNTAGRFYTSDAAANRGKEGKAIITATNAAGESHSVTVHVTWDGEGVALGDFEHSSVSSLARWTKIIGQSGISVVLEEGTNNHVMAIPSGVDTKYYTNLSLENGTKYKLSFDAKGDTGEIRGFWTSSKATTVYASSKTSYNKNGDQWLYPSSSKWTHYEFYIQTAASSAATTATSQRSYLFAFKNMPASSNTKKGTLYIDNVSFSQVGTAESISLSTDALSLEIGDTAEVSVSASPENATYQRVEWLTSDSEVATVDKNGKITAVAPGTATITAKSTRLTDTVTVTVYEEMLAAVPDPSLQEAVVEIVGGDFGEVQPDDEVTVTVTPKEGYLMIPGSLRYTNKAGQTVKVLNKDLSGELGFGEGDGNTFKMVMPNEKVTLTADFISLEEQNFAANTIGTACRYTLDDEGEKVYDGIRFLTRMNLANKFDAEANELVVTYGGKEYTVLELGSLLKREENVTALTYENAVANQSTGGANRMWISRAYTKDSGVFKLVDYTESYIDFTSVMLTSHFDRFYTARGYIRMEDAEGNEETVEYDEITNSISTVVPILPPVQTLEGVTAEKTNWTPIAHVVEPGQKLNYTITVKAGATGGNVTVFEPIPSNATYVSGADRLVGKTAVWELELAANETKTLDYVIAVKDSMDLCEGGVVEGTATQVGDATIEPCHDLYIERAVSKFDEYYVNNAFKALADSDYSDMKWVYWAYYVAYTNSISDYSTAKVSDLLGKILAGTDTRLDIVAPTLYGGASVTAPIEGIKGAPATKVSESDLMVGDVLLAKNGGTTSLYVYYCDGLKKVKTTGGLEDADIALLETLPTSQGYAVIRPRTAFKTTTSTPGDAVREEYNERQEAVIKTGEAFLMRGEKVQYTDDKIGGGEYRWRLHEDAPEDASYEYIKYTNCAAFCNDSYYFGLNYSLPGNMYTTFNMVNATASGKQYSAIRKLTVERSVTEVLTDEQKAQLGAELYEEFMRVTQPGDLMVILRDTDGDGDNDSGHVMMYIGNGKMIHSTGSNYNTSDAKETVEPSIRYGQTKDYFFNTTGSNFIYGSKIARFAVIRPLDLSGCPKTVPENTQNRVNNLTGIVAQKNSSIRPGKTVNGGDTITYTFDVRNTNDDDAVVDILDTIPNDTTLVSAEGATIDGDTLTWAVSVKAKEQKTVSYTVSVNAGVAAGTKINSALTKFGGVVADVPSVVVGNTLTTEQQNALVAAFNELKAEGTELRNLAFVNELYKRAGVADADVFADTEMNTVMYGEQGVFVEAGVSGSYMHYDLAAKGNAYRDMLAPTLYGGLCMDTPNWEYDRTRLAYEGDLVVGDMLFVRYGSGQYMCIYLGGDHFIYTSSLNEYSTYDINGVLERMPAQRYYYAVLRPSLTLNTTEVTE